MKGAFIPLVIGALGVTATEWLLKGTGGLGK